MNSKTDKIQCILLKILIFVYPLIYLWQGFDMTDVGYCLVGYQQIFSDPKSISGSFSIWLTNIIGGVWLKLFGYFGLVGVRFAGNIIVWVTIIFSYKLLNKHVSKKRTLICIFLCLVFTYRSVIIINYNNLTAMFYMIGIYLMYQGVLREKNNYIFASGIISGANIFIRLPNVLQLMIILTIFYYGIRKKIQLKKQIKQCTCFILGYIISIILIVFIMKLIGHWDIFISSITHISEMGKSSSSSHGIVNLILKFKTDNVNAFKYSYKLILVLISIFTIQIIVRKMKMSSLICSAILSSILVYITYINRTNIKFPNMLYALVGISYIMLIISFFINIKKVEYTLLIFLAVFYFLAVPMGSDNGIHNSIHSMWLFVPLAFEGLVRIYNKLLEKKYLDSVNVKFILSFLALIFALISIKQNYAYTYRDITDRKAMQYEIEHKYLKNVYTNKARAKDTLELLYEIKKYVNKDKFLLAYSSMPMIHYLTETRPYMYNSWPGLYSKDEFKYYLNKAQRERIEYPVIVKQKIDTCDFSWPNYEKKFKNRNDETMNSFLKEKKYLLVWSNKSFEIYISKLHKE